MSVDSYLSIGIHGHGQQSFRDHQFTVSTTLYLLATKAIYRTYIKYSSLFKLLVACCIRGNTRKCLGKAVIILFNSLSRAIVEQEGSFVVYQVRW
ncbi:hypothetical protein CEXT_277151 [Caerostris extrusa]|uniref:Uncharacterized protein n=1 Tax=Caerostris extrusa TaxID=172846 RepID=A0AAV4MRK8_CAEEX|nr:hypothetical protein CEXT_277151 [Caerostris extrusa]